MHDCLKGSSSQLFGILNNGITIVTDEIKPVGESVTIVIPLFNIPNNCEDEPLRQSCMFLLTSLFSIHLHNYLVY
jgi:hypothetical protein